MRLTFCFLLSTIFSLACYADNGFPTLQIKTLIDARVIREDNTTSWLDYGLHKTRYGSQTNNPSFTARVAEASTIFSSQLNWSTRAFLHLKYDREQKIPIDIVEGYVRYRTLPQSSYRFSIKAGAFFPPVSLENTNVAWTSPYTISSSAINTWLGEEVRTIGIEASMTKFLEDDDLGLTFALYNYNDPIGTELAWRGWAIHDRKTTLFDRITLVPLPVISTGSFASNANWVEPFHKLDNRYGYYIGANWQHLDEFESNVLYYNNQIDRSLFNGTQYAWNTDFIAAGIKYELPWELTLISQFMQGSTEMGQLPSGYAALKARFRSYFFLFSKHINQHRVSMRFDQFRVRDKDNIWGGDDNQEHGSAITIAYGLPTFNNQHLMLEGLWVKSRRPARTTMNWPEKQTELQVQLSYKFLINIAV